METSRCAKCKEGVGHGPDCSTCKLKYHFKCAEISERAFNRLGAGRSSWNCPSCRDGTKQKTDDSVHCVNTPERTKFSSGLPLQRNISTPNSVERAVSDADIKNTTILEDISLRVSQLQSQFSIILSIQEDLKSVRNDIGDLKSGLNTRLDEISDRVMDVESRVLTLEKANLEIDSLRNTIQGLIDSNSKNEQWVRRSNIQINGIPQKGNENLLSITKVLAEKSGFALNIDTDIDFVTRIAVKNDIDSKQPKPIILRMHSRYKKDDFLAALRKLKDFKASDAGFKDSVNRVYFNDHLSSLNKHLYRQAKIKAKAKNYAYCWVRNCTVMVRRTDSSPIVYIASEEALKKIT